MRFVFISDTHSLHNHHLMQAIPDGDVLIHCGDFTNQGSIIDVQSFADFMRKQPHEHKVIIAGNHDFCFEEKNPCFENAKELLSEFTFLQDEQTTIEGLKIYGSPWQPEFFNWAFNLPRNGIELMQKWEAIPEDTEILITHGPPHGILDKTLRGEAVGCEQLSKRISKLKNLKVHAFGHIHEAYGMEEQNGIQYVNASICTIRYQASNKPIIVDIN